MSDHTLGILTVESLNVCVYFDKLEKRERSRKYINIRIIWKSKKIFIWNIVTSQKEIT